MIEAVLMTATDIEAAIMSADNRRILA